MVVIRLTRREKIMRLAGDPYESGLLSVSLLIFAVGIIIIRATGV